MSSTDNKKVAATATDSKATASQATVLITGASRGIGFNLAKEFVKSGYRVIATARNPATATELNEFAKANPKNVLVVPLDVSDEKSIAALPGVLAAAPYSVQVIDVVFNNAGIAGPQYPKEKLSNTNAAAFRTVFETNVLGPYGVTQGLLPFLKKSPHARVINVSSVMGSIGFSASGGFFQMMSEPAYRVSKAALNMLTVVQAAEYNTGVAKTDAKDTADSVRQQPTTGRVTVVTWHPGYVSTEMGLRSGGQPPLKPEQVAATFVPVAHALPPSNTAVFLDWDGKKQLDW